MSGAWGLVLVAWLVAGPETPAGADLGGPDDRGARARHIKEAVFHPCRADLSWAQGEEQGVACPELEAVDRDLTRILDDGASGVRAARRLDEVRRRRRAAAPPSRAYTPCLAREGARLTLFAYLDVECGPCRPFRFRLYDLVARYPVRVCVKTFPTGVMERYPTGALATLAGWRQDAFLPVFEGLFALGGDVDEARAIALASDLGLLVERFRADLDAPEVKALLLRDVQEAGRLGVGGTPAVVIGRQVLPDLEVLEDEVVTRLARQAGGGEVERQGEAR